MAQSRQTHSKHHGYSVSLDHFLLTANNYQTHPAQMPCIVCVCVCMCVCVCVQVTKDCVSKVTEMQDRLTEVHTRFAEVSKRLQEVESEKRKLEFNLQQAQVWPS